ncbi:MAG: DUF3644 domain-containing protein [Flavobacteriales bacterium]|nr:DUF3644 domain-containing protein [Flavobacteriales bacterium]
MEEIAENTGYPLKGTVKAKVSRDEWQRVLIRVGPNEFKAKDVLEIDREEFASRLSVKALHVPGANASVVVPLSLSDRLYVKARENITLALELYNRPSLVNRLDAFALLFCAAWENLLKGRLVAQHGEEHIKRKGDTDYTKSLLWCIAEVFPEASDKTRTNLETVNGLRNMATHLLMPELGIVYSPILQAGILNFLQSFKEYTGQEPFPAHAVGLMSLTTGTVEPTATDLVVKYGQELGSHLHALMETVKHQVEDEADDRFAIRIVHTVRFAKKSEKPDISLDEHLSQGNRTIVIEKHRDASDVFKYKPGQVATQVNAQLVKKLSLAQRRVIFTYNSARVKDEMVLADLDPICKHEKWKEDDNAYHHYFESIGAHMYSDACIGWIIKKFVAEPDYLNRVKKVAVEFAKRRRLEMV